MDRFRVTVAEADAGALVARQPGYVFDVTHDAPAVLGDLPGAVVQLNDPHRRAAFCTLTLDGRGLRVDCHSEGRGAWVIHGVDAQAALASGLRAWHLDASVLDPLRGERWIRGQGMLEPLARHQLCRLIHPSEPRATVSERALVLLLGVQLWLERQPPSGAAPVPAYGAASARSPSAPREPRLPPTPPWRVAAPRPLAESVVLDQVTTPERLAETLGGILLRGEGDRMKAALGPMAADTWLAPNHGEGNAEWSLAELVRSLRHAAVGRPTGLSLLLHRQPSGQLTPYALALNAGAGKHAMGLLYPLCPESAPARGCLFGERVWTRFLELGAATRIGHDSLAEASVKLPPVGDDPWLVVVQRTQRFLQRELGGEADAALLIKRLTLAPRDPRPELPAIVARAAQNGDAVAAEAHELISEVRASAIHGSRDRRLIAACLEAQRKLPGGVGRLLVEVDGSSALERVMLLRELLTRPPSDAEAPGSARRTAALVWQLLGDDRALGARVALGCDALLHDVLKHQPSAIDRLLDGMRSGDTAAAVDGDGRRRLDGWLDQLIDRLHHLELCLHPGDGPAAAGLWLEELEDLTPLRLRAAWSRLDALTLDAVVERTRRLLENMVARLSVPLPDLVAQVIGRRTPSDRRVELRYDRGRSASLTTVSPATALDVIVDNLLQNALHWAGAGGAVVVTIELAGDPRAPHLRLCVEDSGPGIAAAAVARVLGSRGGLGYVRHELTRLGGTLELARSTLGGAAFRLDLPRHLA
jgi:signal transduction histidine kinase